jgi:two-component system chemotaxis response regulator CheY
MSGGRGMGGAERFWRMKVMIAEDTDSVRFALRLAMEHLGHEVVALAANGEEVLQKYQEARPQCILMDVRMPLLDGLTCTSLLAKYDPDAWVVIVTGGRLTETEAREAGARALVEKPFDLSRLEQVLQAVC